MLRAIRFAAQLDFQIAPNILESIYTIKKRIEIISWERITEEIIKSLKTEKPSIAFYLFKETGLLKYIFPEVAFSNPPISIIKLVFPDPLSPTIDIVSFFLTVRLILFKTFKFFLSF